MAARRRGRRRRHGAPSEDGAAERRARELLRGDGALALDELVHLIRTLNPTAKALDEAERQQRYVLKSELQSLLLTHFPGDVSVVPEPGTPGLVLLSLRAGGGSAGHALLHELEDDARSRAQRMLDEASTDAHGSGGSAGGPTRHRSLPTPAPASPSGGSSEGVPGAPASPSELLARADQALLAYDYPIAERLLRQAVELDPGAPAPNLALLRLLVEHLGAHAEALQLGATLTGEASEDARARALLAQAAVGLRLPEQAERWLRGASGARAGEAWLSLGELTLAAGGLDDAQRHLGRAAELLGPQGEPRVTSLGEGIVAARRQVAARQASELQSQWQAGALAADEAIARASELLDAVPDSTAAQKVLRAVDRSRREARAATAQAEAEQAWQAGDARQALALIRKAQAAGARGGRVEELATAAAEVVRRQTRERQTGVVLERLASGDEAGAWRTWARLPADLREQVAQRVQRPELGWLEELGAPALEGRARRESVEAVVALAAAHEHAAGGRTEEALWALRQHDGTLEALGVAVALRGQLERTLAESRRGAAERQLRQAEQAYECGDRELLERRLLALADNELGSKRRPRAAELRTWLRDAQELDRARHEAEAQGAAGDWFAAREAASRWLGLAERCGERAAAKQAALLRGRLDAELRREWGLARLRFPQVPVDRRLLGSFAGREGCVRWLSAAGSRLSLPLPSERWLVVLQVDTRTAGCAEVFVARPPAGVGGVLDVAADGLLRAEGRHGEALEFDPSVPDVVRSGRPLAPPAERLDQDPQRLTDSERAALADSRIVDAARLPKGDGVLVLRRVRPGDSDGGGVELVQLDGRGEVSESLALPDADGEASCSVAIDCALRRAYVLYDAGVDRAVWRLMALRPQPGALPVVWEASLPAPNLYVLATDHARRSVALLCVDDFGLRVAPLSDGPPQLPYREHADLPGPLEAVFHWLDSAYSLPPVPLGAGARPPAIEFEPGAGEAEDVERAVQLVERLDLSATDLAAFLREQSQGLRPRLHVVGPAALRSHARYSTDAALGHWAAREHARMRRWALASAALERIPNLQEAMARSPELCVLAGLVALFCMDVGAAERAWQMAPEQRAPGGPPGRGTLLGLLDDVLAASLGGDRSLPPWGRRVAAAAEAARALASGDPALAARLLEAANARPFGERTPLALLAAAYLGQQPSTTLAWLHKLRALDGIVATLGSGPPWLGHSADLPLFEPGWPPERQIEVLEQASHWLQSALPPTPCPPASP